MHKHLVSGMCIELVEMRVLLYQPVIIALDCQYLFVGISIYWLLIHTVKVFISPTSATSCDVFKG